MSIIWPIGNKQANELDRPFVLQRLKQIHADRMLDLGAGNGYMTNQMAKVVGATEIYAIDIQSRKSNEETDIKFVLGDLNKDLPYQNNYFDLVTSRHNIEHLVDTDKNLKEIYRVLKPGGYLFIETVNLAALHYRLMLLFGFLPNCTAPSRHKISPFKGSHGLYPHKSVFTYKALIEVTKKHGFELVSGKSHTIYPFPTFLGNIICSIWPNIGMFTSLLLCRPKLQ